MTCPDDPRPMRGAARRDARAFTLIELLVVIAIISLLLAILLPSLSGARRTSRELLCQTHLRALGQSMNLYADAHDSHVVAGETDFMHFSAALMPGLGRQAMHRAANLYNGDRQADYQRLLRDIEEFQCPDFPEPRQLLDYVVNAFRMPYLQSENPGQPGTAPRLENMRPGIDNQLFVPIDRLRRPGSDLIYITEANKGLSPSTVNLHDLFFSTQLPLAAYPRVADDLRHPRGINALFFDTHVEAMRHQVMDVGWPHPLGARIRYFTLLE